MGEPRSVSEREETTQRLVWSAVFVLTSCWVMLFAPKLVFFAVAVFFILASLSEYVRMARQRDIPLNLGLMMALGLLAPVAMMEGAAPAYWALAIFLVCVASLWGKGVNDALLRAAVGFFGLAWIAWLFSYVVELRELEGGTAWVFYTVFVVKIGDAGAYFLGKRWGKTKLIPTVSPSKTWEGAVGQVATSILASLVSQLYMDLSWFQLLVLGLVLGVVAQVGDFVESVVKRSFGAKDSGHVPGLGGFLDVLDSLLLTVPVVYFYATRL